MARPIKKFGIKRMKPISARNSASWAKMPPRK